MRGTHVDRINRRTKVTYLGTLIGVDANCYVVYKYAYVGVRALPVREFNKKFVSILEDM